MTAAPLVASADTNPRSIKSISTGPRPVLITCAPSPHTTPDPFRLASTIAPTPAFRSAAASMLGSESSNCRTVTPPVTGRAKSSALALLLRDFSGYVRTPVRSNSSYGNGITLESGYRLSIPTSENEHRVPITIEPVALPHRQFICGEPPLAPAEGRDQHQQGRFRQVKVGKQPADDPELVPGMDEQIG